MTNTPLDLATARSGRRTRTGRCCSRARTTSTSRSPPLERGGRPVPAAGSALIDAGPRAARRPRHRAARAPGRRRRRREQAARHRRPRGTGRDQRRRPPTAVLIDPDAKPTRRHADAHADPVSPRPRHPDPGRSRRRARPATRQPSARSRAAPCAAAPPARSRGCRSPRSARRARPSPAARQALRVAGRQRHPRLRLTFKHRLPRGTYTVTLRALDAQGQAVATTTKRVRVA